MTATTDDRARSTVKDELLWAAQEMLRSGLVEGTAGNLAARLPDGNVVLTPSSLDYLEMGLDDLVVCDLDGNVVEGHRGPTSEKQLHLAVLAAYPEIGATMHCHAKHVQMFAVTHQPIPAVVEEFDVYVGGDVECSDYKETGSAELAEEVARRVADRAAVVMANHGLFACGKNSQGHPPHRVARRAHRRGRVGRPGPRPDRRGPGRDRQEVRLVLPLRPHREVRLTEPTRRTQARACASRTSRASQGLRFWSEFGGAVRRGGRG